MEVRRLGGRAARKALRAAPLAEEDKAVKPGMHGGRFAPLTDLQIKRVNESVMDALENIGLSQAIPSCIELLTKAGCTYTNEGRLTFPRSLVEDTIADAARNFVLHGQDAKHDMELTSTRVYFGTAGAAVHVVDVDTREYRESHLLDLYNIARIVDNMEHIHFFQRPLVCRDLENPLEMDFNTCYASISGTSKHVGTSWVLPEHFDKTMQMLHIVAGSEGKWRKRPFVSSSSCFVVPPMRFAEDACEVLERTVRAGMPILLLAAGQAGATSPASLAGAVVQEVAETLAGLVYVNQISKGHPAMIGIWPFVSDLRTGAMSGGSGEQAVLMAACGQMGRYYDLPTGIAAGMADSKVPDAQSGFEKGYTTSLAGHSGANMVYESAGMQASLLGLSYEGFVIDNDMLGAVNRSVRGIEVDEDSLSIEVMRDVCIGGPNHYLGHDQTMNLMQKDYVYPEVGDRTSPKEWAEQGSTTVIEKSQMIVQQILSSHYPRHINDATDEALRAQFPVCLPRDAMRPS
ncbi:MAG: trimethylamine methyltransferase family protein [Acidiferrobacterales bacterium]|nr:trimethylamine methyltransferase family protein [Acidiferrobacterales bacterium]